MNGKTYPVDDKMLNYTLVHRQAGIGGFHRRDLRDILIDQIPQAAHQARALFHTKNVLIPRASHNFEFFAEVCQQMNGKTYPVDDKISALRYCLRPGTAPPSRWRS
jgi:hypothetical protein